MGKAGRTDEKGGFSSPLIHSPGAMPVRIGFVLSILLTAGAYFLFAEIARNSQPEVGEKLSAVESRDKELTSFRRFFNQAAPAARDFLINNHINATDVFAQDLRKSKTGIAKSLEQLRQSGADPARLKQLQRNAADYLALIEKMGLYSARQKSEEGYDYLREIVQPAHNAGLEPLRALTETNNQERARIIKDSSLRNASLMTWFYADLAASVLAALLLSLGEPALPGRAAGGD